MNSSVEAAYAFAMIAFFIAISVIGPMRVPLSYAEPVVSAGLGVNHGYRIRHHCARRLDVVAAEHPFSG